MTVSATEIRGLDWNPDGYSALSGHLLGWATELDALFISWARDLGCAEHRFPTFISLQDLQPLSYLRSFPHLATFAFTHDSDPDSLAGFSREHSRADAVTQREQWNPARQLLTPAACYHFYHRLARGSLDDDLYLTTCCTCHRREVTYSPLERQWCFNMRELVCIGTPNSVEDFVDDCRQRIDGLIGSMRINACWKVATDPFFDPQNDPAALAQQLEPVKKELTLKNGLAIGSINFHRSYFGECYDICRDGKPAHSACVAFGIERWLLASAQAHGADPSHWPHPAGDCQ